MTSACHAEGHEFESRTNRHFGFIAQSVEQRTENPCVAGSIPVLAKMRTRIFRVRFCFGRQESQQFGFRLESK